MLIVLTKNKCQSVLADFCELLFLCHLKHSILCVYRFLRFQYWTYEPRGERFIWKSGNNATQSIVLKKNLKKNESDTHSFVFAELNQMNHLNCLTRKPVYRIVIAPYRRNATQ